MPIKDQSSSQKLYKTNWQYQLSLFASSKIYTLKQIIREIWIRRSILWIFSTKRARFFIQYCVTHWLTPSAAAQRRPTKKTEESQKSDWNQSLTRQEDSPWLTSVIENQPPPCRKQWCHPIIYGYWWLRVSGSCWLVLRFPHLKAGAQRPPTVTGNCDKLRRRLKFKIGRKRKIRFNKT